MRRILGRAACAVAKVPLPAIDLAAGGVGEDDRQRERTGAGRPGKAGDWRQRRRLDEDTRRLAIVADVALGHPPVGVDHHFERHSAAEAGGVPQNLGLDSAAGRDVGEEVAADIPVAPALCHGKEGRGDRAAVLVARIAQGCLHRRAVPGPVSGHVGRTGSPTGRGRRDTNGVGRQIRDGGNRRREVIERNRRIRRDVNTQGHIHNPGFAGEIGIHFVGQVAGLQRRGQTIRVAIPVNRAVAAHIQRHCQRSRPSAHCEVQVDATVALGGQADAARFAASGGHLQIGEQKLARLPQSHFDRHVQRACGGCALALPVGVESGGQVGDRRCAVVSNRTAPLIRIVAADVQAEAGVGR